MFATWKPGVNTTRARNPVLVSILVSILVYTRIYSYILVAYWLVSRWPRGKIVVRNCRQELSSSKPVWKSQWQWTCVLQLIQYVVLHLVLTINCLARRVPTRPCTALAPSEFGNCSKCQHTGNWQSFEKFALVIFFKSLQLSLHFYLNKS